MDSDNDPYFEESSSEDEQKVAGPLHIQIEVNVMESPELPLPGSPSPAPTPPAAIPVEESFPVWELFDDGNKFMNFYTQTDVLDLKDWSKTTRQRRNEEGYVVEEPMLPQNFIAFLIVGQKILQCRRPISMKLISTRYSLCLLTPRPESYHREWQIEIGR